MNTKPFDEVIIGDLAIIADPVGLKPSEEIVGQVIWKGTTQELKNHEEYSHYGNDLTEYEVIDYEWVLVETEDEGVILFNYNCDPSGVIVEDKRKRIGPYIHNPDLTLLATNIVGSGDKPETYFVAVSNQVFNEEGDGILKEPVINIVIAATGDLNIAKAIYRNVEIGYCDNNVKSVTIEGIDGLICHKRVVQKYVYETKEIKYDKN